MIPHSTVSPHARTSLALRWMGRAIPLLLVAACSDATSPGRASVDRERLFAAPTAAEVAQVRAEWATRSSAALEVREEFSAPLAIGTTAGRLRVVSHVVDGHRHFGAIVSRSDATAGSLPVLLYAHGGDAGVSVDELSLLFLALGDQADDVVWVVPSFRAEPLRVGAQVFRSGGDPSPWDRDVDDALSLLSVAVATESAADPARVAVLGLSRGAGVGLLMGVRDPRIDAVVAFFGPTDFFDPWTQDIIDDALDGRPRDLPGLSFLDEQYLQPLRRGAITVDAVRRELVRRSVVLFAASLPAVQVHHGTADAVVAFSQAQRLDQVMRGLGRAAPSYQFFAYPGAGHNPIQMTGSTARAAAFIDAIVR
jgi:acetyl esterase/lipase